MFRHTFASPQEKKLLFLTELVKCGVEYDKAEQAASILASPKSEDLLTPEELQLTREVCELWLRQRQRMGFITQVLNSSIDRTTRSKF